MVRRERATRLERFVQPEPVRFTHQTTQMKRCRRSIGKRFVWTLCASLVVWQMGAASAGTNRHDADREEESPVFSVWDRGGTFLDETEAYPDVPIASVCRDCCCPVCCCLGWTVRAGSTLLARGGSRQQSLIFEENEIGKPGREIVNARDFGDSWAGGPDLSVIRCLDCCRSVEVRYLGIDGWTDQSTASGDLFVVLPWAAVPASGTATFLSGSDLYSVEVNLRRWTTEWLVLLAGFRAVQFNDRLLLRAAPPGGPLRDFYEIDVDNNLYGGPAGSRSLFRLRRSVPIRRLA